MIKFRPSYDKDATIQWLNDMSKQGYAMTGFAAGFFTFEECTPGKYIYQIDFGRRFFAIDEDYREFMNDTGVEIVSNWGYWIYLRKLASEGDFTLYTDVDSSIEHYKKILKMFKFLAILETICFCICVICAEYHYSLSQTICSAITGLLAIIAVRAAFRTRRKLEELMERKGDCLTCTNRKVSPLIPFGYLLNMFCLMFREQLPAPVKCFILIIAIALMGVGIFQSRNVFRE